MTRRLLSLTLSIAVLAVGLYLVNPESTDKNKTKYDITTSEGLKDFLFNQKKIAKTKQKYDKPDQAMLEEIAIRSEVDKPFAYKDSWRFEAQKIAKQSKVGHSLHKAAALDWIERGPGNVGGRTRAIVVHPNDEQTWWVGAVGGGIWKTSDAGQTWKSVTDDMPVISVTAIDICQSSPAILYAGTGEGFFNSDAIIGDGLFKSVDFGESWTQVSNTVSNSDFRYVNRIIVDPADSDRLLVATNSGLYLSVNGGNSWSEVFSNGQRVQQIIANPLRFDTQFIAVNTSGIYKSTDGGLNWDYVSEEIDNHNRIEMAISEADTNILYASPVNSSSGLLGFYRSDDAGDSWADYGNSTNWLGGQGWYDNTLVVSPLNSNIIFVGGIDLYRVQISGSNMTTTKISNWYSGAGYPYVHADQHFLKAINITGNNFSIIAANDGGIHYSTDMGVSWQELNNNYNVTQYYDADKHPTDYQFIGGTQDNGTHLSPSNPTFSSSWDEVIGGDGFDCAWDKSNPSIVYGTLYNTRVYKSTNGGSNFSQLSGLPESNIFHTPLEMDPNNSNKLFTFGNNDKLYYTEDAGANWTDVTVDINGYSRAKIAVSLSNSDIVWAGATTIYTNISTNGGTSFSQINQPSGSPHSWLTGISTHPTEDATAFLTIGSSGSGKIYRTEDLGQTWENINNNLPDVPVHTVLVMPFNTDEIWIGTDIGLFISTDEGASWQYSDNGIPAVAIRRLKIVGQNIVAATHGRGIWSVFREELSQGPLLAPNLDDVTVPNPNTGELKIKFTTSSNYDSTQILVNSQVISTLDELSAAVDTFGIYQTNPPEAITVQIRSYRTGEQALSEEKSRTIYEAASIYSENFDILESDFFGDLTADVVSGFTTPLLNSPHPYGDGTTLDSYMGTPITINEGSTLSYKDVAIIEKGEPGSVYGDEDFWDYVTVEGSDDGENWTILIEPYDARSNSAWSSAYDNEDDGDDSMFETHAIDLTTTYPLDTIVYLRFRLFADAYTNGWGWGIDDVEVTNTVSAIATDETIPGKFELVGNYPNPFNPSTTIRFSVANQEPVSLKIYNSLGQLVRTLIENKTYSARSMHEINWNGTNGSNQPVASGLYFYQLSSGSKTQIKKMMLIK